MSIVETVKGQIGKLTPECISHFNGAGFGVTDRASRAPTQPTDETLTACRVQAPVRHFARGA
jgi:hypothetical protein